MKYSLRIGAILFCAVLLMSVFASCKSNEDDLGNVVYGRYVETDITPKDLKGDNVQLTGFSDGKLEMLSSEYVNNGNLGNWYRWRSQDGGKNWENVSMEWSKEYIHDYSEYYERGENPPVETILGELIPLENGDIITNVTTYEYKGEDAMGKGLVDSTTEYLRIGLDGSKQPLLVPEVEQLNEAGEKATLRGVQPLPGNRILSGVYIEPSQEQMNDPNFDWSTAERNGVYDATTMEKLYDVKANIGSIMCNDKTLFIYDYEEEQFKAFHLSDGTASDALLPSLEFIQQEFGRFTMGNNLVNVGDKMQEKGN